MALWFSSFDTSSKRWKLLIQSRGRSFIFSTAAPIPLIAAGHGRVDLLSFQRLSINNILKCKSLIETLNTHGLVLSFIQSWNSVFLIRAYLSSCSLGGKEGNVAKKRNLESGARFSWFDWNPHPKSYNLSYCRQRREGIESQQVLCRPFYTFKLLFQQYALLFSIFIVIVDTYICFCSFVEQAFVEIRFSCDCNKASYSSSQLLQVYHFLLNLIQ